MDPNCGDPRVVPDGVTAELERFQPSEDHPFCELINLLTRSYNIPKEVKRPHDIDNTHVISLIARKMPKDDLRVWSRHIYNNNNNLFTYIAQINKKLIKCALQL